VRRGYRTKLIVAGFDGIGFIANGGVARGQAANEDYVETHYTKTSTNSDARWEEIVSRRYSHPGICRSRIRS